MECAKAIGGGFLRTEIHNDLMLSENPLFDPNPLDYSSRLARPRDVYYSEKSWSHAHLFAELGEMNIILNYKYEKNMKKKTRLLMSNLSIFIPKSL